MTVLRERTEGERAAYFSGVEAGLRMAIARLRTIEATADKIAAAYTLDRNTRGAARAKARVIHLAIKEIGRVHVVRYDDTGGYALTPVISSEGSP
jgi:hypothetical protein